MSTVLIPADLRFAVLIQMVKRVLNCFDIQKDNFLDETVMTDVERYDDRLCEICQIVKFNFLRIIFMDQSGNISSYLVEPNT